MHLAFLPNVSETYYLFFWPNFSRFSENQEKFGKLCPKVKKSERLVSKECEVIWKDMNTRI